MGFLKKVEAKLEHLEKKLTEFKEDQHAEMGKTMGAAIMAIVALVIIAVLGSGLLPTAISSINDANTTGWSTGTLSMWDSISIFIVLVFLLLFVALALRVIRSATE